MTKASTATVWRRALRNRWTTVVVLAAVLSADHADRAAVGAVGPALKTGLHIGNTQLGMLASAFSISVLIGTMPAGALADRFNRVRLLTIALATWCVVMAAAALAPSFWWLFSSRVLLGVLAAVALPTITSLVGDLFPRRHRGRLFTVLNAGELVGTGIGFILAGFIGATISWRWAFGSVAVLGAAVTLAVRRLDEPERGAIDERYSRRLPKSLRSWHAYVATLRVRTNAIVIVGTSLGQAFFGILRSFGVVYFAAKFGLNPSKALPLLLLVGAASLGGFYAGGRGGDRLIDRGLRGGRVLLGAAGYLVAAVTLAGAEAVRTLPMSVPLFVLGGFALSAPNPPLDAVRIDVIPPHLRGRAESVRVLARTIGEALGPLAFGVIADHIAKGDRGVQLAALAFTPLLAVAGVILLFAVGTYESDADAVRARS